jgi:hypothetical protein
LVRIVISKIEALRGRKPGIILRPCRDLAFGVVGLILLRDQIVVLAAVQVLDLLRSLIARVRKVKVVRLSSAGIGELA